jgi:hypothetical protein
MLLPHRASAVHRSGIRTTQARRRGGTPAAICPLLANQP